MIRKLHRPRLAMGSVLVFVALCVYWDHSRLTLYLVAKRSISDAPASLPQEGYLINTPMCQLPQYDPFDPSIQQFIKKPQKINCNPKNLKPLTFTEGATIRISSDEDVLRSYGVSATNLSCCFQEITGVPKSQPPYKLSECFPINPATSSSVRTDGALVICSAANFTEPVYKNVHFFIRKENIPEKINKFSERQKFGEARPLNLIILGIDSTSRQNFIRFLPKTFEFLSEDPATLDFLGYNKVADNTLPNVSPVILGSRADDIETYQLNCYKSRHDYFDACPFIWKNFTSEGYTTVYAEDASQIQTFYYNMQGFSEQPTDFDARPYFKVSEKEIASKSGYSNPCLGLQLTTEVIYDQILRALDNLSDSIPVFGFFWTSGLTHDRNEKAASLDEPTLNFLQKFYTSHHRNNTIMLFFGDHGLRFGKIRSTYLGALEERLPFVRMIFPPWFPEKFNNSWKNLLINQKRLMNNYDLHNTILDILHGSFEVSKNPKSSHGYGQSLFLKIPINRTCESIHIPLHFCACQSSEPVPVTDTNVTKAAQILTNAINTRLSGSPQCALLELQEIHSARVSKHHPELGERISSKDEIIFTKHWKTYTLILQTKPGGGRFEGSVVEKDDASWLVLDNIISRVNLYGNQSYCVQDTQLKKFCYCT